MLSCCGTDFMHSVPGRSCWGPGLGKQTLWADQLFSGTSDRTMGSKPDIGVVQTEQQSRPRGQSPQGLLSQPRAQQLLPGSLCIKSVPQQLSTDTPQPGIISQVSGQGFSPLLIPHSMGTQDGV